MTLVSIASSVESSSGSSSGFVTPSIRRKLSAREEGWEERTKFEYLKKDFEWWKNNFLTNYGFVKKHFPQLLTVQSSMATFVDDVWKMKKIVRKMRQYSKFFEPADWAYFLGCEVNVKEYKSYFHFES